MPLDPVRPVRIRREVVKSRYRQKNRVYKYSQLILTIPAKFRDLAEPFVGRDLKLEIKKQGKGLIIEAQPLAVEP